MGSYLSDLAPLRTAQRIERDRRRARRRVIRRVLYVVIGVILLGLVLFCGYGPYYVNLSPSTDSGGPVSIQTNHAQYRDSEAARVTVTNRLHVPIYTVYFPDPDCSIYLVAQAFYAGQWQQVDHAGSCPNTPPLHSCGNQPKSQPTIPANTVLQINPGTAYVETWRQYYNFDYVWDAGGGQGTFRILFVYTTDPQTIQTITAMTNQPRHYFPLGFPDVNNVQVATSAPLQITHDGTRPHIVCV